MNKKWWKEAVVYQVYPRSFYDSNGDGIGDLKGVTQKLDYLKDLGIDVIWLNPVYKSPNADNGYDISDYKNIMDEFGTIKNFEDLLCEAHKRHIKIIMDLVVNHSSDEHEWFKKSKASKENPYRDYYIWRKGEDGYRPNNWTSFFSGPAWEHDNLTDEYYLHLFAVKQPDLNWENNKVRNEVYSMMKWWLDKGIDGFRMDVINLISKVEGLPSDYEGEKKGNALIGTPYYANGPRVHEYLKEMNREVLSKYDIMTVGETPFVTPETAELYVNEDRDELNMVFQFELMDIDSGKEGKWDIVPWKLSEFKRVFYKWYDGLKGKGWNSLYLNNHDQPRMVSRFGDDSNFRVESAKLLGTLLHTWPGTPYIYEGEEIGMTNVSFDSIEDYKDIETLNVYKEMLAAGWSNEKIMDSLHKKSRDNARTPMQWDESENAGFTSGTPWIKVNPNYKKINVKSALEDSNSIFHYYKRLIQLRKKYDVVVYGNCTLINEEDENIFSFTRTLDKTTLLVMLNFSTHEREFSMPSNIETDNMELLLDNYETHEGLGVKLTLRPYEARVYMI